ncbi:MAG TPA: hypothetical protein VHY34_12215 [Caulobacteraceae bacterium]|jgi:hypothetical protein|nr:hypothetical protein [Caulobacteraceae bacterium]
MPEHKFTYTVSGVHLSEEHQQRISQAIAVAVANELVGEESGEFTADNLSLLRIYGGIWQKVFLPGSEGKDPVLDEVGVIAQRQ